MDAFQAQKRLALTDGLVSLDVVVTFTADQFKSLCNYHRAEIVNDVAIEINDIGQMKVALEFSMNECDIVRIQLEGGHEILGEC